MISEVINDANANLVIKYINPFYMKIASIALSIFVALQLTLSEQARETFKSIVRTFLILGSMMGAGGSIGLYLLYKSALKYKILSQSLDESIKR